MSLPIRVDVVSDIVCPWCYIGKRRLEAALKTLENEVSAEIVYHPFQLDPTSPKKGRPFRHHMESRFGRERAATMFSHVEQVASEVGLDFNFAEIAKDFNTLDLHRLLTVAYEKGLQSVTKEALMDAHFVRRVDLTDEATVISTLTAIGWSEEDILDVLKSDKGYESVQGELEYFRQLGVTGVPFFILNNKYALSGAQPESVFVDALRKVLAEAKPEIIAAGAACDPVTGECN